MWKKEDEETRRTPPPPPAVATAPRPEATAAHPPRGGGFATIGPSIVIRGEVSGDEDLLIQGQVDGSVALGLHSVTIGDGGRVKAGITGRVITVEGAVEGDLSAEEQIILRGTARVKGDLNAPRVILEDGATFRGLVDMGSAPDVDAPKARAATATREPPKEATPPPSAPRDTKPKSDAGAAGRDSSAGAAKPSTG